MLMELTGIYINLRWIPREENVLADALTNEDFSAFKTSNRIALEVGPETLPVMFSMLAEGKNLYEQVELAKIRNKRTPRVWPKTQDSKRLKVTQPW